jgi:diaminopimelate decarboxylase
MISPSAKELFGISVHTLSQEYGTPTFLYHKELIEQRISEVKSFDTVRFAQKACSNLAILSIMRKNGVVVDAVSAGEIHRAVQAGFRTGPDVSDIVFTADIFDQDAIEYIKKYQLTVNVGSPDMITQLGEFAPGSRVILRINPGFGHGHSQKVNTGGNLSKHGIWHKDINMCLELAEKANVNICGVHMHIGSGSDFEHLSQVCDAMVQSASLLGDKLHIISAGGGLPIPYKNEDKESGRIDVERYYSLWKKAQEDVSKVAGHHVELEVEPGRYLVAEAGALLTQIRSVKNTGGTDFYLIDAGFDNLIRPAMYGAYHEISIASQEEADGSKDVVVAGPLCESCDVFTQSEGGFIETRKLPNAKVGDYLVLHDAGAYGAAMSSNYNTRKLAAEVLIADGKAHVIRKRQSFEQILENESIPEGL